jgi:hypothetical protein
MKKRLAVLLLLSVSCAQTLPVDGAPCPCATGWVCCPGTEVCAADEAHCPAPAAPVVTPAPATVSVTRRLTFASSDPVTFSVEEAAGGSIDAAGHYTAPAAPGTYHVVATRTGTQTSTRVEVTVVPLQLYPLAGRYGGPSSVPVDGTGENARFAAPFGGVLIGGFYYVIDGTAATFAGGQSIRRVDLSSGKVDTLFSGTFISYPGTNLGPVQDGAQGEATFMSPDVLADDGQGNLLVGDACLIRAVKLGDLSVTTLLGDKALSSCDEFAFVRGLASDGAGAIYFSVGDAFFGSQKDVDTVVHRFTRSTGADDVIAGVPGVHGTMDGQNPTFSDVGLLAYDHDGQFNPLLLVVDNLGQVVRALNLVTGEVNTLFSPAGLSYVGAVAPPFSSGTLSILNDGQLVPYDNGQLQGFHQRLPVHPTGLAEQLQMTGPVLFLPTTEATLARYDLKTGFLETVAGRLGSPPEPRDGQGEAASFGTSAGIGSTGALLASADDSLFVWEASRSIRKIDRAGNVTTVWTGIDAQHLAGGAQTLYFADGNTIHKASASGGDWTLVAGGSAGHAQDGTGANATFAGIQALVVEPEGTLLAVDYDNAQLLRRIDPVSGTVTTLGTISSTINGGFLEFNTIAIGPPGKLIATSLFGVHEIDLATLAHEELSVSFMDPITPVTAISYDAGRVYFTTSTQLFQLDPATKQKAPIVGVDGAGAVRPGALSQALLHDAQGLTLLPNGDLVILDAAERVLVELK